MMKFVVSMRPDSVFAKGQGSEIERLWGYFAPTTGACARRPAHSVRP
jgi:hypothetical protein